VNIIRAVTISIFMLLLLSPQSQFQVACAADTPDEFAEFPAELLRDKIRGGLLGQILGNLNGIPHEMEYIDEPGNVQEYVPALPDGARTDDDTDLEWVYLVAMQRHHKIMLPPHLIVQLWKERINKRIWCSNQYARQLMDIGFEPPLTGCIVFNPWAEFNISGQFVCESFGLLAPAMPQTAAKIGLNYTRVTIDAEPAQTTQLFTTMIATTFVSNDIDRILDAGLSAIDPKCEIHQIVSDIRRWYREHPQDWRTTRRLVKERYSHHGGAMRDRNGYELNTASTIAALLYGQGDFVKTLQAAFNFGWDADNNAATAGTIVGVIKGYRWMMAQDWKIVDRYHNTTRDNMPEDETITSFADRIIDLAEQIIIEEGGKRDYSAGQITYRIRLQEPANIVPLLNFAEQVVQLQAKMKSQVQTTVTNSSNDQELAFAGYCAICLDLAQDLRREYPQQWAKALQTLSQYPKVVQVLFFHSPFPAGDRLRQKALAAGLKKPTKKIEIW
jgi:hypothetical protein